jgi:hypothetical protein
MYIDELPSFAAAENVPIAGEAAFVSFVDRPVFLSEGNLLFLSFVNILALEPNAPLSTNNVSTTVRANPAAPSPFTLWEVGAGIGSFPPPAIAIIQLPGAAFTSVSCTPTFADPCAIDYTVPLVQPQSIQHLQIEGLFD